MAEEYIKMRKEKSVLSHMAQNIDYGKNRFKWEANKSPNKKPLEEVTFCSTQHETAIMYENPITKDNEQIVFQNNYYLTNDEYQIKFIRATDLFGVIIYENEFPASVKKEMEYDRYYVTRAKEEYE